MENKGSVLTKDEILSNFEELNKLFYPDNIEMRNQLRSRMIKLLYDD